MLNQEIINLPGTAPFYMKIMVKKEISFTEIRFLNKKMPIIGHSDSRYVLSNMKYMNREQISARLEVVRAL